MDRGQVSTDFLRAPSRNSKCSGFTMLELVVAVSVAMVVSALAVPQMKQAMVTYRLKTAVGTITTGIQATRYRSIYQGIPYKMVFSNSNSNYQLSSAPTLAGTFTNQGNTVPFSNTGSLLGSDTTMVFRPSGGVQPGPSTPCPSSGTVATMTVTYMSKTGTIKVSCYGNINVTYSL